MNKDKSAWQHALAVAGPALTLADATFVDEIRARLRAAGVVDAVARHDSAPIYDHVVSLFSLQGISDAAATAFDAEHGGITHAEVAAALASRPSCPRLESYWHFASCGYRKGSGHCAEPEHRPRCPLPRHDLRKGGLNIAAYSFFLFVQNVCGGDLVGWIDERLAKADPGPGAPDRAARMRAALLDPIENVAGTGPKLWSMILADVMLGADPDRERWVTAGATMVAIDSLVHAFLHRSGILHRFGVEHPYGPACYGLNGCAVVVEGLSARFDARAVNPAFPAVFPRLVQNALWRFCAGSEFGICNGNQIDDRARCRQVFCPAFSVCDRISLKS